MINLFNYFYVCKQSQHLLASGGAIPGGLGPGDDPEFIGAGGGFDTFIDDGKYFG